MFVVGLLTVANER